MKSFISIIVSAILIAVAALVVAIKPISAMNDRTNEDLFCEEDFANVTLCTKVTNEELQDPCNDDNESCSFWASEGECKKNPDYMLVNCAKSCKECQAFLEEPEENDVEDMLNKRSDLNVEQERSYGRNKIEMKKTYDYSSRIDEYRKALFQHPSTTSKTRKLCINELSKCTYYASMGLCEQRVIFMLETCPLACMMCEEKEQFDQCVGMRHPFDVPIFVSQKEYDIINDESSSTNHEDIKQQVNTVHSFFQSKKADSKWVEDHSAEFVNDPVKHKNGDSWIVQLDNVISSVECQSIIDLGNKVGWEDSATIFDASFSMAKAEDEKQKISFKRAKCYNADIQCDDYASISNVKKRLSDLTGLGLWYFEASELIHFPEAKGYQSFQHNYELHDVWKIVGPRVLSFYIPLSTTEAGGYMGFPLLDWLMIQPKEGQVTVLSNVLNSDPNVMNEKMAHEVLPVQKGELYALRIHVRQFDYESAKSRGYEHCF